MKTGSKQVTEELGFHDGTNILRLKPEWWESVRGINETQEPGQFFNGVAFVTRHTGSRREFKLRGTAEGLEQVKGLIKSGHFDRLFETVPPGKMN